MQLLRLTFPPFFFCVCRWNFMFKQRIMFEPCYDNSERSEKACEETAVAYIQEETPLTVLPNLKKEKKRTNAVLTVEKEGKKKDAQTQRTI